MRKCKVDGCSFEGPLLLGMCSKHYQRWYRHGSTELPANNPEKIKQRIQKVVIINTSLGCWEWQGTISSKGYGKIYAFGKPQQAHRVSYIVFVGEIPKGMQLDHKYASIGCPRHCVNPEHLQLATPKENSENLARLRKDNTTGFRGVHKDRRTNRWSGRLNHNHKTYAKGGFTSAEEANEWVLTKRNELYTNNYADRHVSEKLNVEAWAVARGQGL